jgi:hypothetical protein
MNRSQSTEKKEELRAFRSWLTSLTTQQLVHAMQCEFTKDDDGESHDYDLLKELVDGQVLPPTPIHPKGMGYWPPASQKHLGGNDGRDEEARIYKDRFTRPRLFQLMARRRPPPVRRKQHQHSRQRYDVICRRKVTVDGEVLGLGCTEDQRNADELILKGALLYRDVRLGFSERIALSPAQILRMLAIVSRGHFLQGTVPSGNENYSLFAPWLAPTERWFSLPMFLASWYEVALWSAFRGSFLPSLSTLIRDATEQLPTDVVALAHQKAMARTLKTIVLPQDRLMIPMVLDTMLYRILNQKSDASAAILLDFSPLLGLGTVQHEFRLLLRAAMEEEYVLQLQEAILSLDEVCDNPTVASQRKKGKKKKRRRKIKQINHGTTERIADEDEVVVDDPSSDHHLQFVDSTPPSMERTRKLLIAMSVLEDVLDCVFARVGFAPDVKFVKEPQNTEKEAIPNERAIKTDLVASNVSPEIQPLSTSNHIISKDGLPREGDADNDILIARGSQFEMDFSFFNQGAPTDTSWTFDEDEMNRLVSFPNREKSVFVDFFMKDNRADASKKKHLVASSTAASIASSTDKEPSTVDEPDEISDVSNDDPDDLSQDAAPTDEQLIELISTSVSEVELSKGQSSSPTPNVDAPIVTGQEMKLLCVNEDRHEDLRSPLPPAPRTPSPQLSPILVSLADLKDMQERTPSLGTHRDMIAEARKKLQSSCVTGSLPSSPIKTEPNVLSPSWSRDDLRIKSFTDYHLATRDGYRLGTRRVDALVSYRNAVMKPVSTTPGEFPTMGLEGSSDPVQGLAVPGLDSNEPRNGRDYCAQSETAVEAHGEDERWHMPQREDILVRNFTPVRDEPTTVSVLSQREPEELATLREERNTFRDMCLTLGAEVAKLKNILAAQKGIYMEHRGHEYLAAHSTYNPEFMQTDFHGITKATTIGATSDAGIHRGDHESARSEDGTDHATHDYTGKPPHVHVHQSSSGATAFGSDSSLDQNFSSMPNISAFIPPINNDTFGTDVASGFHSRLSKDIIKFLKANTMQLQQADSRRATAIHRLSRLVTALWPRAQVKLYGSYVTGLSLPSSDIDFVICLPAVHKNAPAITPGVLEGRNAINESSQKMLARKLKGESWIDTRSIKIIERTVVPVIKVATKDTRARTMQLDISFDGPVHHGLEAIDMVNDIVQQLPMVRPIVLVLKQFLLDRGLSTAYTGGLSSYCLFLMVTRYLQEQPSSWGDCGSLLMGFLDFYGNSFDPRATGISVSRRLYFARRAPPMTHAVYQPPIIPPPVPPPQPLPVGRPDHLRRHSFTEKGNMDPNWNRPPRYLPPSAPRFPAPTFPENPEVASRKSYTFDPLWVEDPLSAGNNVGRNAFRIFQVQRAFSDAHRALVANLEWENACTVHNEVVDYPLLKCLLQSKDIFYDLDDHNR